MKTLVKVGLASLVVAAVLLVVPPKQAEARRYWVYSPAYSPMVYRPYYPRRVVYRPAYSYYAAPVYYAPPAPVYYGGYGCGCY
ncbi:MAG: hypothetical protein N2C12_12945 [Planctomycetales bacterium]